MRPTVEGRLVLFSFLSVEFIQFENKRHSRPCHSSPSTQTISSMNVNATRKSSSVAIEVHGLKP